MTHFIKSKSIYAFWALVGLGFFSCSENQVKDSDNVELIYNEAMKEIKDEDYLIASDLLNEIKRRFPQSKFAVLSELRSADIEYDQGNYLEAAQLYKNFVTLHPNHSDAAYAQHRLVLSFLNDAPDKIARDQNSAQFAAKSALDLEKRYPQSKEAKEARSLYLKARLKLAQKDAYVAAFYQKQEVPHSALRRWKFVLDNYSDLKDFKDAEKLFKEANEQVTKLQGKVKEDENIRL